MSAPEYTLKLASPSVERRAFARPGPRAWVRVGAAATAATVIVNGETVGRHLGAWTPFEFEITRWLRDENELEIRSEDVLHTTNGFLPWLGVRWTGARDVEIRTSPTAAWPPARQRSRVDGTRLLVDEQPFRVRGILHWGYYPELGDAWPSEEQMRREITDLQSLGFNLIKFCLWVPPPRYYELCDELGMFVWQEYPTWAAPLDDPAILSEYEDLFCNDAPYASVILRTMTCENDQIDPEFGRRLVELAHELIPGSVVADNSGWLCSERHGDFHDEHISLSNMQWRYYAKRVRPRLTKPLLLGETMGVCGANSAVHAAWQARAKDKETADAVGSVLWDPDNEPPAVLASRRFQVETLARDLPDAGYVMLGLRDEPTIIKGLYSHDGRLKYTPEQWAWHREQPDAPREFSPLSGPVIGPRKGQWKCRENLWLCPDVHVLDDALPRELIERECGFELLSGRVLSHCEGTRVLVELRDATDGRLHRHPLVAEFASEGRRQVVSAFRHDTPAGRELWEVLQARRGPAPEIGPLVGTSLVLEDWEISFDERAWQPIKCDTALVNDGRNVFEGWATYRTRVEYPGGRRILHCESVGDYYEIRIDGELLGSAGPRVGTWDGKRETPCDFDIDLSRGYHDFVVRVRDWRGAGAMVGPVYIALDLDERVF